MVRILMFWQKLMFKCVRKLDKNKLEIKEPVMLTLLQKQKKRGFHCALTLMFLFSLVNHKLYMNKDILVKGYFCGKY